MRSANSKAVAPTNKSSLAGVRGRSLQLNKKDLKKFSSIAASNPDVEFLYLRDNEFDLFDPYISLDRLKVLDLSINNLTGTINFFPLVPSLRHLYLTGNRISSLEGITNLPNLETLCLSENEISSFEGLQNLDNLRVLSLNYNNIGNFRAFPYLPSLYALNLYGNPIAEESHYRKMAISVASTIDQLDKVKVLEEEREQIAYFCGKIVFCIAEGMVIHGDNVEEQAETFLLEMQRDAWKSKPLQLQAINLRSAKAGSNELVEGVPVTLAVCLQDVRPAFEVETQLFHSRFLVPVRFRLLGDASEVLVVGEMNTWRDPIPMQRGVSGSNEVSFQTTLYLPSGDYEYRYMVDGQERVMPDSRVVSKYEQGPCNIYHVDEGDIPAGPDETQTILHIRWLRSNAANGFDLIEGENGLTYTPTKDDVGYCLRAECLAYERGDFSFLYFDISTPIVAGAPTCERLEINGTAAEGETLEAEIEYSGGLEGQSVVQWFRVDADGSNEVALESGEVVEEYTCTLADVGKRIRLDYTPVRSDHESGAKVSVTTDVVSCGVPTCKLLDIRGPGVEGEQLIAYTEYTGGEEGDSTYQWFRHNRAENNYEAIQGERSNVYTPGLEDVFHNLAVEYRPVSKDGVSGDPSRCVLENFILPGPPSISNLSIAGVLQEGMAVMVDFDYKGGRPAAPIIQWFLRRDNNASAATTTNTDKSAAARAIHADPNSTADGTRIPLGRSNQKTQALSVEETGYFIEVEVTPVREDGIRGNPARVISNTQVSPSDPVIKSLKILVDGVAPEDSETVVEVGSKLECQEEYSGGEQGDSKIEWQRDAGNGSFDTVSTERAYLVSNADANSALRLQYTPVRVDGETGESKIRFVTVGGNKPSFMPDPMNNENENNNTSQQQQPPAASGDDNSAAVAPATTNVDDNDAQPVNDNNDIAAPAPATTTDNNQDQQQPTTTTADANNTDDKPADTTTTTTAPVDTPADENATVIPATRTTDENNNTDTAAPVNPTENSSTADAQPPAATTTTTAPVDAPATDNTNATATDNTAAPTTTDSNTTAATAPAPTTAPTTTAATDDTTAVRARPEEY